MLYKKYIDFYHNDEEGGCCGGHHGGEEGEHHCCGGHGHEDGGEHHCHNHEHGEGEHHCCGGHGHGHGEGSEGHHCCGHHHEEEAIPEDRAQALLAYMINHNAQHAFEIRDLEASVSENAALLMEQAVKAMAISVDFLQDALSILQAEGSETVQAEKAKADAEFEEK